MPHVAISSSKREQSRALDRSATGIGWTHAQIDALLLNVSTFVQALIKHSLGVILQRKLRRSRWPRRLRRNSEAAWLLGSRVRIRWGYGCLSLVFLVCCVGRAFCDGPITRPGESYRECVIVWSRATITLYTYKGIGRGGSTEKKTDSAHWVMPPLYYSVSATHDTHMRMPRRRVQAH